MADEALQTCELCGATIYPEQLEEHTADRWAGKLACAACLREKRANDPAFAAVAQSKGDPGASGIHGYSSEGGIQDVKGGDVVLHRELLRDSMRATRCRTFHCKMTDASLSYLNDQINAWVDSHAEVEIKFATSNIGVVEGKHADPHYVVTIFY